MKFSCTEHCKNKTEKCLCKYCDEANDEWQKKCDKQLKTFNPSERRTLDEIFYCDYLKREITKIYCKRCANYYRETCPLVQINLRGI